jgi:hypothetical protein
VLLEALASTGLVVPLRVIRGVDKYSSQTVVFNKVVFNIVKDRLAVAVKSRSDVSLSPP